MTRIDFYILADSKPLLAAHTACRLAEKAYRLKHAIYIHTSGQPQTSELDMLLWTFRDASFVPHQLHRADAMNDSPIVIGHDTCTDAELATHHQLLINLDQTVPPFFSRFERVAEIVGADETQRNSARERFKFYRERGYELQTHELTG